jgi:hypothetical protein
MRVPDLFDWRYRRLRHVPNWRGFERPPALGCALAGVVHAGSGWEFVRRAHHHRNIGIARPVPVSLCFRSKDVSSLMLRTAIAAVVVALVGGAGLWEGTVGFRAFTTQGARRISVLERPRVVPDVRLIDMEGRELTLAEENDRTRDYRVHLHHLPDTLRFFWRVFRQTPSRDQVRWFFGPGPVDQHKL